MYTIVDFVTRQEVKPENYIFTGAKNPWEVIVDINSIKEKINANLFRETQVKISKYFPFMPISKPAEFVSLKEGATPLLRSARLGAQLDVDLYFKLESQNPTGSFKDRGSALELSVAKELGVEGICVASTGNMAASCACYAAAANMPCFVFVPEGTPASKLAQTISYGGRIVQVKGTYNDAATLAEKVAREINFYLAGDYAFRVEGAKTAGFEIIDQLYYQTPDAVIVPIGCGTNLCSYAKGFSEYRALGLISKTPKIIGSQAEGAASVVNSFVNRSKTVEPLKSVNTIASAIAIGYPLDGVKALDAIYSSEGEAVSVSDKEILEAQYSLAKEEGLFVEPSSATSLAVLKKLLAQGKYKNNRVVCVLTGDGLKDTAPILKVAIKPPVIRAHVEDFLALYESSFFSGRTIALVDKGTVLFSSTPSFDEVKKTVRQYLESTYSDKHLGNIQALIEQFLKKGKKVTFADFQDIVQDVLENSSETQKKIFSVEDFTVTTIKDKKPQASVEVSMNGKTFKGAAEGVGPVDAVINALQEACGVELRFSLVSYQVAIRSQGTDAVVCADISLERDGKISIGEGTSPDVIQASIGAFERAYNGLYTE